MKQYPSEYHYLSEFAVSNSIYVADTLEKFLVLSLLAHSMTTTSNSQILTSASPITSAKIPNSFPSLQMHWGPWMGHTSAHGQQQLIDMHREIERAKFCRTVWQSVHLIFGSCIS
jgi:hypothetical protein